MRLFTDWINIFAHIKLFTVYTEENSDVEYNILYTTRGAYYIIYLYIWSHGMIQNDLHSKEENIIGCANAKQRTVKFAWILSIP